MRVSCNGCRVLRKACSENCTIRPCLQWIRSPDSQANATVFLAKFYGRAGLTNLINAGPPHLRPAIFRSLLYEACGRIVNPIYGSVGLYESGSWQVVHDAAEAVLRGAPIPTDGAGFAKACDIRHVCKEDNYHALNRVRSRRRFKRTANSAQVSSHSSSPMSDHHHHYHHSDAAETDIKLQRDIQSSSDPAAFSDGDLRNAEIHLNLTLGL